MGVKVGNRFRILIFRKSFSFLGLVRERHLRSRPMYNLNPGIPNDELRSETAECACTQYVLVNVIRRNRHRLSMTTFASGILDTKARLIHCRTRMLHYLRLFWLSH